MCLRLYIDRFNPFGSFAAPYSCWLVILTIYNLPPKMCMRQKFFFFLSTIILGSNSLGQNINVCLWPLIDELKYLWSSKTSVYDVSRKYNFLTKTTLMWTINNFSSYEMVSGWSTHVKLACPYCMENNKIFTLINDGETFFFIATSSSCQQITSTERTRRISLLAELKGMLHCHFFKMRNCMT